MPASHVKRPTGTNRERITEDVINDMGQLMEVVQREVLVLMQDAIQRTASFCATQCVKHVLTAHVEIHKRLKESNSDNAGMEAFFGKGADCWSAQENDGFCGNALRFLTPRACGQVHLAKDSTQSNNRQERAPASHTPRSPRFAHTPRSARPSSTSSEDSKTPRIDPAVESKCSSQSGDLVEDVVKILGVQTTTPTSPFRNAVAMAKLRIGAVGCLNPSPRSTKDMIIKSPRNSLTPVIESLTPRMSTSRSSLEPTTSDSEDGSQLNTLLSEIVDIDCKLEENMDFEEEIDHASLNLFEEACSQSNAEKSVVIASSSNELHGIDSIESDYEALLELPVRPALRAGAVLLSLGGPQFPPPATTPQSVPEVLHDDFTPVAMIDVETDHTSQEVGEGDWGDWQNAKESQ